MKKKCLLALLMIVLTSTQVVPKELKIDEALSMAEGHSYRIKASRAQSEAFREGLGAAVAERLPTLTASGVASYRDEVAQLEVELPTGEIFRRDVGLKENYQADLRLSMPVFTGGRLSGGVDLARATSDYYDAVGKATLDEVFLMARLAYISLYKDDRLIEAKRAGVTRATTTLADVQSLYDAGAADSVNLLDARFALTEAKSRLQNATSVRRQDEITLSVMLGLGPAESITLNFSPGSPDLAGLVDEDVSDTKPELVAANSAVDMSRSLVKVNQANLLPVVAVFGGYSWGKPNLDQFHDEFNDFFTVGTTLNWSFNLGGKSRTNIKKAKRQLRVAEYEYENTKEQLNQNARVILESLELTFNNYQTALEHFRTASDNYRLANEKHREGVLSANRLIEIEANLSQAEASLASAVADFFMVQSQYYHAVGSNLLKEGM